MAGRTPRCSRAMPLQMCRAGCAWPPPTARWCGRAGGTYAAAVGAAAVAHGTHPDAAVVAGNPAARDASLLAAEARSILHDSDTELHPARHHGCRRCNGEGSWEERRDKIQQRSYGQCDAVKVFQHIHVGAPLLDNVAVIEVGASGGGQLQQPASAHRTCARAMARASSRTARHGAARLTSLAALHPPHRRPAARGSLAAVSRQCRASDSGCDPPSPAMVAAAAMATMAGPHRWRWRRWHLHRIHAAAHSTAAPPASRQSLLRHRAWAVPRRRWKRAWPAVR